MAEKLVRRAICVILACLILAVPAYARTLIPGGQSIGVALRTDGAVVIGASDIGSTPSPARLAGLRSGDVIVAIDGKQVENSADISEMLTTEKCRVTYERRGQTHEALLKPVYDESADVYRLGVWVRDSAAGIGTLTYFDPETGEFGALGHPVTDADTGTVLPVQDGTIYENMIIGVEKGRPGEPGEILGQFYEGMMLGDVDKNSEFGIFGHAQSVPENAAYPAGLEIASRSDVKKGKAELLSTVGGGLDSYDCEILSIESHAPDTTRSFMLRVTDPALLETTGGIVQGMSGSPIIQNGKLVGAVTHVLVNDPTRGYGIFIENMLDAAG